MTETDDDIRKDETEYSPAKTRSDTRKSLMVFGGLAGLMLLALIIIHGRAWFAYSVAGDANVSVQQRLSSAVTAQQLEPFMPDYRARALQLANQVADDPSATLDARVAAARQALRVEPASKAYFVRYGYLYAQRLARDGRLLKAVDVMAATYKQAVGNAEMLAFFKHLQDELALETNRKAHLQHGHEGPGGTLAPSDIER